MQAAQQATNQLDTKAMQQLEQMYQATLAEIHNLLENASDGLGEIRLSQLSQLSRDIESALQQLSEQQKVVLSDGIISAAENGGSSFIQTVTASAVKSSVDDAIYAVKNFKQKDGLQLSERLWRVERNAKEVVAGAVERAVILSQSASEAAQEFQRNSQPIPAHIQQQMKMSGVDSLKRTTAQSLMKDEGAPYHQIKRVMRTEINRAHGMAFQNAAFEDGMVVGTKFKLSPNHPKRDVCDMHAKANLHGLGEGVYPQGKSPWPAHPNTLSYEQVVFVDEVTDEDRAGQTNHIDWLKKQDRETQKGVLGHDKKVSALNQGHLSKSMITTPWKHLEPKLKRKGIDTATL